MQGARNWLADDQRAQRVFWLLVVISVLGGIVSVASYKQLHLVSDAVLLINVGMIVAVMVIRALAVNARWLAALGVGLEVLPVLLHWHPVGVIDLLAPSPGAIVLFVLVFYLRRHMPQDDNDGTTSPVNAMMPGEEAAGSPASAAAHRPLPGDPDFTYPSPPR